MRPGEAKLCPSAPAAEGAILLGVVGPDGAVGYVQPPLTIDSDFLARAASGRPAEERFRFSAPCIEASCGYWTENSCGVIEQVLARQDALELPTAETLPHCSIRRSCRWFAQSGPRACSACPYVITRQSPAGAQVRLAAVPAAARADLTDAHRAVDAGLTKQ